MIYNQFNVSEKTTPKKIKVDSADQKFLDKLMDLMETNIGNENYWVDELTKDMNASRSTFFRKLKKITGKGPSDFMRSVRLKRAAQLLSDENLSIAEVSYAVGFSDPNYFSKCFRKAYDIPPSKYHQNKTAF